MKRWLSLLVPLSVVCSTANAANAIVNVGGSAGNAFTPQTVTVNVGDTVTFVNKGGSHNVVADDNSFRCARGCDGTPNGSGNISNANWVSNVVMTKTGNIGYFCEAHGQPGAGMFGTIKVNGVSPPPPPPPPGADTIPTLSGNLLAALIGLIAATALGVFGVRRRR